MDLQRLAKQEGVGGAWAWLALARLGVGLISRLVRPALQWAAIEPILSADTLLLGACLL